MSDDSKWSTIIWLTLFWNCVGTFIESRCAFPVVPGDMWLWTHCTYRPEHFQGLLWCCRMWKRYPAAAAVSRGTKLSLPIFWLFVGSSACASGFRTRNHQTLLRSFLSLNPERGWPGLPDWTSFQFGRGDDMKVTRYYCGVEITLNLLSLSSICINRIQSG